MAHIKQLLLGLHKMGMLQKLEHGDSFRIRSDSESINMSIV